MTAISRIGKSTALLVLGGLSLLACSKSPDVTHLASDAHFLIAGHKIVVPIVAIRGVDHTFNIGNGQPDRTKKASNPGAPTKLERLNLQIRQYRYAGELTASAAICPLLKRKWSETWCRGQARGLLGRLPEKFDLLDRSRLDDLKHYRTVGGELAYDQVKDMVIRPSVTEIGCDARSLFCTAMVEVSPGLLAVWTVWSDEKTGHKAEQMAETQGTAIVQFVRRAVGPIEDSTLVDAD